MVAAQRGLRAVKDGEKPPRKPRQPRTPKTVTQAAEKGTPKELMVAMRNRIAKAVEDPNTPARDLAALTKRLTEVVKEIEAIEAREKQRRTERARSNKADAPFNAEAI